MKKQTVDYRPKTYYIKLKEGSWLLNCMKFHRAMYLTGTAMQKDYVKNEGLQQPRGYFFDILNFKLHSIPTYLPLIFNGIVAFKNACYNSDSFSSFIDNFFFADNRLHLKQYIEDNCYFEMPWDESCELPFVDTLDDFCLSVLFTYWRLFFAFDYFSVDKAPYISILDLQSDGVIPYDIMFFNTFLPVTLLDLIFSIQNDHLRSFAFWVVFSVFTFMVNNPLLFFILPFLLAVYALAIPIFYKYTLVLGAVLWSIFVALFFTYLYLYFQSVDGLAIKPLPG